MAETPDHDDLFRKRLHNMEVPPPEFVWPRVEQELRRRRRRFVFVFWLTLAVAVGSGLLWRAQYQAPALTTAQTPETSDAPPQTAVLTVDAPHKTAENPSKTTQNTDNATIIAPEQPTQTARTTTQVNGSNSAHNIAEKSDNTRRYTAVVAEQPVNLPHNVAAENQETPHRSDLLITEENTVPNAEPAPSEEPAAMVSAIKEDNNYAESTETLPIAALPALENQPLQVLQKLDILPLLPREKSKKPGKTNNRCYNFSQNPNVWLVDAYAGPSFNQKRLYSQPDNQPYRYQRLNTEKQNLAFNAGVRAAFLFKRFYIIRTGVHYDQSTEVFEHFDPDYVLVTTRIRNVGGQTIIDTLSIQYGSNHTKTYNRLSTIDIPLLLGAELRKGNTGFSFNGGALINVAFEKRGQILDPTTHEPAWFTPNRNELAVFRKNTGVSIYASAQWFCHLKPRLRLFIEPYFREILNPITLPTHPVEERHRIWGLQCGVTQILDKKK